MTNYEKYIDDIFGARKKFMDECRKKPCYNNCILLPIEEEEKIVSECLTKWLNQEVEESENE